MVSSVNSRTNATSRRWHLTEIDLRFAPGLHPGRSLKAQDVGRARSDLLALFVASALLLGAFASLDVTVKEKEEVRLAGVDFNEVPLHPFLPRS